MVKKKAMVCIQSYDGSEYVACNTTATQAVWIKRFVENIKINMLKGAVNVFCNNKTVFSLMNSGAISNKGKHIDMSYHYVIDIVDTGKLKLTV